jgi:hypothetical protein
MFTARSNFDVHRWERLRKMGQEMGDERIICPAYVPCLTYEWGADD